MYFKLYSPSISPLFLLLVCGPHGTDQVGSQNPRRALQSPRIQLEGKKIQSFGALFRLMRVRTLERTRSDKVR